MDMWLVRVAIVGVPVALFGLLRPGPFTAGYVLVLAIAGPLAASRSHILAGRMPSRLFPAPAVSRKDSS